MHGYGVFVWEDGRRYEGDYKEDKKHGRGAFYWSDGRIYNGEWANGHQHGFGTYTAADGKSREGEWFEGKRTKWLGADQARASVANGAPGSELISNIN